MFYDLFYNEFINMPSLVKYGSLIIAENIHSSVANKIILNSYSKSDDIMGKNLISCWQLVLTFVNKKYEINLKNIAEINRVLTDNITDVEELYSLEKPAVLNIPSIITIFEKQSSTIKDICEKIYNFILEHRFFKEGNKRTAYFVINWYLLQRNIGILYFTKDEILELSKIVGKVYIKPDNIKTIGVD